jgi:hypothetical protein
MSRERIGGESDRPNMVNGAAAARFAGIGADSAANRESAPKWAKKSLSLSEFP